MKHSPKVIQETIIELLGEDIIPIIKFLKGKKNISEFVISENLGIEVNKIRNILYRMHTYHIVTYHRKKDRIKGWYISYWTLNFPRMNDVVDELKLKKLDMLKEKLKKEEENINSYFLCPQLCIRVDFDKATDFGFFCPECGSLLGQQDNSKTIENLKNKIKELEKEIKEDSKRNIILKDKEDLENNEEPNKKIVSKKKEKPKKKVVLKKKK
jgi:transcription initiation factor TFIIE subunit alpha